MAAMRKWTPDKVAEFADYYATHKAADTAARFGLTIRSVYCLAQRYGASAKIAGGPRRRKLTDKDLQWLRLNFPHTSTQFCAVMLHCHIHTIQRYANDMELTKTDKYLFEESSFKAKRGWASRRANEQKQPTINPK